MKYLLLVSIACSCLGATPPQAIPQMPVPNIEQRIARLEARVNAQAMQISRLQQARTNAPVTAAPKRVIAPIVK